MRKLGWIVALVLGCSKPADPPAGRASPGAAGASASAAPFIVHHRKHPDHRAPVVDNPPPLVLEVVTGGTTATWRQDAFDKVARFTQGHDGVARDVWSLRELAHQLVGPTATVTRITGVDGSQPIDPAAWQDPTRTPLLHTTRRGTLKFRWADATGAWGENATKDVTRIELAP
jgi:hypothetical protein